MALVELRAATERPSAPYRCRQILEAAEDCFRQHGFHACSMAQIAARAGMSVGHIYRYFACKEAIIAAIVERDVQAAIADFDALPVEPAEIVPGLLLKLRGAVERLGKKEGCALWPEVLAESARNPEAARVLAEARRIISQRLCALIAKAMPSRWTPTEVERKVDMLLTLKEGVAFRSISGPTQDWSDVADQVMQIAAHILDPAPAAAPIREAHAPALRQVP